MLKIRQIDHLVLRVAGVERMIDFYGTVLGCTVERRQDDIGLVQLRAGLALIDLVDVGGKLGRMGGAAPGREGRNLDHLCLRIEPFDGDAIRAHLAAHGVEAGEIASRYGAEGEGPSIYVTDPEGNVVELKGPPWDAAAGPGTPAAGVAFRMSPIGFVRSPFDETRQIPKGCGARHEAEGIIEVLPEFEIGLTDIEGFSHLFVLWVFDRVDGFDLMASPPSDTRPHGVFSTRSPRRPNPIGLTVVRLLGRDGNRLRVGGVDMLDGTPVLDLKPYLSGVAPEDLNRGWLAEAEARQSKT